MAASPEWIPTNINKMFYDQVRSHAEEFPSQEVCGIVLLKPNLEVEVRRQKNESKDPSNSFVISPDKFLDFKLNNNILGIYHSHYLSTERPSKSDKELSEELGIPYLIYSLKTKKFHLHFPQSYQPAPLLGRPHIKGFFECTCILKDYFITKLKNNITNWNKNYWLPETAKKANKLLYKILNENLIECAADNPQMHDVLVFEIKKGRRLHIGIYQGDDTFIHQPRAMLSSRQLLDDRWQRKIKAIYRQPSCV